MVNYTYSFIIPHHNSPELLNRCLDSIPKREDIQIIVVDDNSQADKRPNVTRQDVEVLYIDASHTKGAGHARNIGLTQAKGKWLLFPDCDDYYTAQFIDVLDAYKDENIDVLYFNFLFVNSNGIIKPENTLQKRISSYDGNITEREYIKYCNNTPWDKMVKNDYIRSHRMYYEEVTNGNDVLFSLFVASYTDNVAVVPYRLYCYVKNANSIGTKVQTDTGLKCRIIHFVKHSAFNNYIFHPEWNSTIWHYLSLIYKRNGWKKLMQLLPFIIKITLFDKKTRNEWIEIIENHR